MDLHSARPAAIADAVAIGGQTRGQTPGLTPGLTPMAWQATFCQGWTRATWKHHLRIHGEFGGEVNNLLHLRAVQAPS